MSSALCKLCVPAALASLVISGCTWDPPHSNPLDPDNYRYQPAGGLTVVVVDRATGSPLLGADVRLPELDRASASDSIGKARFDRVRSGEWLVTAERRADGGLAPFALDSLRLTIADGGARVDTFRLAALTPPHGRLSFGVRTLLRQPIVGASVMLDELGRFAFTDLNGIAYFDEVPVGRHWVRAFRQGEKGSPVYARDSVEVVIEQARLTTAELQLDALPIFLSQRVNSLTFQNRANEDPIYQIHIKANVTDPDGLQHIRSVIWRLYDRADNELDFDTLFFQQDSGWKAEEPGARFPTGKPDGVLALPFVLEAYDASGNYARSEKEYLARVIKRVPELSLIQPEPRPEFDWSYSWTFTFDTTASFNYLVRVTDASTGQTVYNRLVPPAEAPHNSHRSEVTLSPGVPYLWEVWALDLLGNRSRSPRRGLSFEG